MLPDKPITTPALSSKRLLREIFDAPSPEAFVRTIPAQSLYLILQDQGLEGCVDLLALTSVEQTRLVLDFDLWSEDQVRMDRFWDWLGLPEATESLEILQKLLKSIDLKIISLVLSRCIDVLYFEEGSDIPPGPRFHTPDQGKTWIEVKLEDPTQYFLLSRLLALIFETNIELFYQLIAIPGVATESMLEEEAFQDRQRRLHAEGVPDDALIAETHKPLYAASLRPSSPKSEGDRSLAKEAGLEQMSESKRFGEDIPAVPALVHLYSNRHSALHEIFSANAEREEFVSELTYLTNAALVFFKVDFHDTSGVQSLVESVRGILEIGLKAALSVQSESPLGCYQAYGLVGLYRLGLGPILELRKEGQKALRTLPDGSPPEILQLVEGCARRMPVLPAFLNPDGSLLEESPGTLVSGWRAITDRGEIESTITTLRALNHPA